VYAVPMTERTVRTTVELSTAEHRDLRNMCTEMADTLDLVRVGGADVVRALIAEARDDPALRDRIAMRVSTRLAHADG
jgi:hypothetical protein